MVSRSLGVSPAACAGVDQKHSSHHLVVTADPNAHPEKWSDRCGRAARQEEDSKHRRASIQGLEDGEQVAIARHGTPSGAVFNLCNCMFGVGVLALPSAFAR